MKLIVGLGNPGDRYAQTPHNAGFMLLDMLYAILLNECIKVGYSYLEWKKEDMYEAYVAKFNLENEKDVVLLKPQTFMNESGRAVKKYLEKNSIALEDVVIVHDDLDIILGEYKFQYAKSPKGHNGILSLENHLKTKNFWRMRIGIEGRENKNIPGEDYVLINISEAQKDLLNKVFEVAIKDLMTVILEK